MGFSGNERPDYILLLGAAALAALLVMEAQQYRGYLHPCLRRVSCEPGTSVEATVALFRDAVSFFTAYLDLPALVWVGHLFPEIGEVPSGGPNVNHVLRRIGDIYFFDGIGFAIVVGHLVAVGPSYVGVRALSAWLRPRIKRRGRTAT